MTSSPTPLVLFLHAVGGDASFWEPQVRALTGRYAPHAINLVRPASEVSMGGFAEDALRAIDAAGHADAHVVGLSMGGVVALELYRRAPDKVRSLTLANTWDYQPQGADRTRWAEEMLGKMSLPEFSRMSLPGLFAPTTPRDVVEHGVLVESQKDRDAYLACWRAMFRADLRPVVPGIRVPVLLVGGALDPITPTEPLLTAIKARLPSAQLVDLEGASHFSNLDQPDAFNRALLQFLDRVEAARSPRP